MIKYVTGDATNPIGDGQKIIVHVCNDIGAWGAGFVLAISKKWKQPERSYRAMSKEERVLGAVQFVPVEPNIIVANMIGQHDVKASFIPFAKGRVALPPIRYDAVLACLRTVATNAKALNATVHMPRIGCGLAGGNWGTIEKIVDEALKDINVIVYDFK